MNGPHSRARTRLDNIRHRNRVNHKRECEKDNDNDEQRGFLWSWNKSDINDYQKLDDGCFTSKRTRNLSSNDDIIVVTPPYGGYRISESMNEEKVKEGLAKCLQERRRIDLNLTPKRYRVKCRNTNNVSYVNSVRRHPITNAFIVIAAAAVSILANTHPGRNQSSLFLFYYRYVLDIHRFCFLLF